ncbi:MAG: hypothetical protein LUF04_08150 [Bacteroides sp.]|nr:hypothetical protein [Bacteroides sp.]
MSIPYHIIRCIFLLLLLAGVGGCTTQIYESTRNGEEEDGTCLVRVHIQTTGNSTRGTRAGGYSDTHIETIDILSFREDNSMFQYRALAGVIDLNNQ